MNTKRWLIFPFLLFSLFLFNASCEETATVIEEEITPPKEEEPETPPEDNEDLDYTTAHEVIKAMGAGFNLGNTFDLFANSTDPGSIFPIIDHYYDAGMRHIRIPTTWMDGYGGNTLADASGNVDFTHSRFEDLQEVIDYAIAKDMYVVLNAHHEHWLYEDYDGSAKYTASFENLWKNIATHFKDYPKQLIFEVLNEPQGKFGDWSDPDYLFSFEALNNTRAINDIGHKAIRTSGGNNSVRIVMVGVNGMGNHGLLKEVYSAEAFLPGGGSDDYLAVQLHTYDPWEFCGQDGDNSKYPGKEEIEQGVSDALAHAKKINIPVNYGEFGVGRETNNEVRDHDDVREFYKTIRTLTAAEGMSSTCWDDRGWFGLVTKKEDGTYDFLYNIVPYMLQD